jgi:uncharacterized protein (DUF2141 family)
MKIKTTIWLVVAAVTVTVPGQGKAQNDSAGSGIVVTISNLKTDAGQMRCTLFRSARGFPRQPELAAQRIIGTISGRTAICVFQGIPKGPAAVTAFHDENANQKLDMAFGILPKEGLGWSNNPKVWTKPPEFDQARFMVGIQPTNVNIRLNQR